jgi:predicted nicotinamide N-methyase
MLPELRLHTASEVTPLWHATQAWLDRRDLAPPFWAFAWAGGVVLARAILDGAVDVQGKDVVDLATGGGVVAIAAALAGATRVRAFDLDPVAVAAARLNAEANAARVEVATGSAADAPSSDVVLAGDVFYDLAIASAFTRVLAARAAAGAAVFAGDPGRSYAPALGADRRVVFECDVPVLTELEGKSAMRARVIAF